MELIDIAVDHPDHNFIGNGVICHNTYHGRFKRWGTWKESLKDDADLRTRFEKLGDGFICGKENIDQIEAVIDKLIKQPFTRQAQMITWMPSLDLDIFDPACLQSIWYRMAEEDGEYYLNSNVRIRSNDAWGAYFMNSFGITMFNREVIADEIEKRTGKKVHLARMNWQADSWHIYGKDIEQAKARLFDRLTKDEDLSERTFDFNDEMIQEIYNEATEPILNKIANYDKQK